MTSESLETMGEIQEIYRMISSNWQAVRATGLRILNSSWNASLPDMLIAVASVLHSAEWLIDYGLQHDSRVIFETARILLAAIDQLQAEEGK